MKPAKFSKFIINRAFLIEILKYKTAEIKTFCCSGYKKRKKKKKKRREREREEGRESGKVLLSLRYIGDDF